MLGVEFDFSSWSRVRKSSEQNTLELERIEEESLICSVIVREEWEKMEEKGRMERRKSKTWRTRNIV